VVTSGIAGDNTDVDGRPSGVPSPISEGEFSLHPPTLNPAEPGRTEPLDSPRADGATANYAASREGGPASGDGEAQFETVGRSSDNSDEIASLETELRSGEEELAQLRVEAGELQNEIRRIENQQEMRRNRLDGLRPASSITATVQSYLEKQKEILQERGQARASLASVGLKLKDLAKAVGKSPLDESMARKTGRGGQRPSHPVR
jgi:chromosome segregation ATPase